MKHIHNKLVRDNIPDIIKASGKTYKTRILDNQEYIECLKNKLLEECNEVVTASDDHITEELADLLEVVEALKETLNISTEEIESIRHNKGIKNGVFKNKIYLEYVEDNHE